MLGQFAVHRPTNVSHGLASAYDGELAALDEEYLAGAEGALMLPEDDGGRQALFFKGDRCLWYHWQRGAVREDCGTCGTASTGTSSRAATRSGSTPGPRSIRPR